MLAQLKIPCPSFETTIALIKCVTGARKWFSWQIVVFLLLDVFGDVLDHSCGGPRTFYHSGRDAYLFLKSTVIARTLVIGNTVKNPSALKKSS